MPVSSLAPGSVRGLVVVKKTGEQDIRLCLLASIFRHMDVCTGMSACVPTTHTHTPPTHTCMHQKEYILIKHSNKRCIKSTFCIQITSPKVHLKPIPFP